MKFYFFLFLCLTSGIFGCSSVSSVEQIDWIGRPAVELVEVLGEPDNRIANERGVEFLVYSRSRWTETVTGLENPTSMEIFGNVAEVWQPTTE